MSFDINDTINAAAVNAGGSAVQTGLAAVSFTADANLTAAGAQARAEILSCTSTVSLTATRNFVLPLTAGLAFIVYNGTTGAQAIQFIGASGTGVTIASTKRACIYCDGTNYVRVTADT